MASTREYDVIFGPQPEGGYTVYVPDLPGCVSEGDTIEDATEMIRDAMAGFLDSLEDRGYEPPKIERRKLTPA